MSTETKTPPIVPMRAQVSSGFTKTTDAIKYYGNGCAGILLVDPSACVNNVQVAVATRADMWGRTADPAGVNPFTLNAGDPPSLSKWPADLYGQGAQALDLQITISVTAPDTIDLVGTACIIPP